MKQPKLVSALAILLAFCISLNTVECGGGSALLIGRKMPECTDQADCYEGYCRATCLGCINWCYTTKGDRFDGKYIECKSDYPCKTTYKCAEACIKPRLFYRSFN